MLVDHFDERVFVTGAGADFFAWGFEPPRKILAGAWTAGWGILTLLGVGLGNGSRFSVSIEAGINVGIGGRSNIRTGAGWLGVSVIKGAADMASG